ncbi:hypothetical protein AWJ20_3927 [Sugiyamaella lignohabitans]|uniref:Uncharacterized protein n=1 Tax=Sugiyamaella lignohabitans TaxID=796027 RepID=A0A161HIS4_9ASCO|nr:uncharacterized protein AWJ20_3927 [Sugiyamaella lignohabitans]ANB11128.1 hypothetical protein AWJ20_3927 [Sugiyamaella lignohabitans]
MSSAASKRLIKELSAFSHDPNPALDALQLQSEDDLFTWLAVLRGPADSPYEGQYENDLNALHCVFAFYLLTQRRWTLAYTDKGSTKLSSSTADDAISY